MVREGLELAVHDSGSQVIGCQPPVVPSLGSAKVHMVLAGQACLATSVA